MVPFEVFIRQKASPAQMDALWAKGWRHFGQQFFRYATTVHGGEWVTIQPLRIDLSRFAPSRSQRRVLKRNRDVRVVIREALIDQDKHELFYRHRERFEENVPDTLYDFLSGKPATVPCRNHEICVYDGGRLLAASFLDLGQEATSAVYAMFEPTETRRSLGILTMLRAIEYSRERGCRYYYPGYATREPSFYDYKKRFAALEYLDWHRGWLPLPREEPDDDDNGEI